MDGADDSRPPRPPCPPSGLEIVRRLRDAGFPLRSQDLEHAMNEAFERPSTRLAVYGSLAPGESNAWVLQGLRGDWLSGTVRGVLRKSGWGAGMGYPGFLWSDDGNVVKVRLFVSADLPDHWARIDEFEGRDYLRSLVPVHLERGGGRVTLANIYQIRGSDK
jgi:gamma-glutamylcyclotransferase (GGCT)/AIG2-like uncharacterized protein YtfP